MSKKCYFPGCLNNYKDGYRLFTITEKRRTKLKWLEICGLPASTSKYAGLCEGHFSSSQFVEVDEHGSAELKSMACPDILQPSPPRVFAEKVCKGYTLEEVTAEGNFKYSESGLCRKSVLLRRAVEDIQQKYSIRMTPNNLTNVIYDDTSSGNEQLPKVTSAALGAMENRIQVLPKDNIKLRDDNKKLRIQVLQAVLDGSHIPVELTR